MINVLCASQNYEILGGSDRYFHDTVSLLNASGKYSAIPFCTVDKSVSELNSDFVSSRVYDLLPITKDMKNPKLSDIPSYLYNFSAKKSISNVLDFSEVSIAHLNIYYGQLTSSILGELKKRRIPIVQTLHEYKPICPIYTSVLRGKQCNECNVNSYKPLLRNKCKSNSTLRSYLTYFESNLSNYFGSISAIEKFICVSHFQYEQFLSRGMNKNKLQVIHNFSQISPVDSIVKEHDRKQIFYFGRLESVKGIVTLCDAFKSFKDLYPEDVDLVIAGAGSLENMVRSLDETDSNIIYKGHLEGSLLIDEIRNSYVVVCPSEWNETFGLNVIESMGSGVPVIASRIGGMAEIFEHEVDGLYFEPGNGDELTEMLFLIFSDDNFRNELAMSALQSFKQKFTPEVYYKQLDLLYSSILDKGY